MNLDPRTSRRPSSSQAADTSLAPRGSTSHSFHFDQHQSGPVSARSTQHSLVCFFPFYPSILAGLSRKFEMFASAAGLMSETVLEVGCQLEPKVDIGGSLAALLSPSDRPSFRL